MDTDSSTSAPGAPADSGAAENTQFRTHSPFQRAVLPRTAMGTLCAKSWDDPWIEEVEAVEKNLGRRICGARLSSGRPCEVESDHDSGRCRYHGGFALTGAPKGNRNAQIHALYSRRLRTCSPECPMWRQCPCAGPDVERLDPALRPTCPYEQTEYDIALEEAQELAATNPQPNPMAAHIAHNIAMIQVLLNRAALALRNAQLTTSTLSSSRIDPSAGSYIVETKPSAQLTAFVRIAAEYRRFVALLMPGKAPKRRDGASAKGAEKNAPAAPQQTQANQSDRSDRSDRSDKSDKSDPSDRSDKSDRSPSSIPTPSRSEFLRPPGGRALLSNFP